MHSFFGDNVKKLRTAKKMSQEQLADIFGITKAGISYWETGRSEPNFATVQKLADLQSPHQYLKLLLILFF